MDTSNYMQPLEAQLSGYWSQQSGKLLVTSISSCSLLILFDVAAYTCKIAAKRQIAALGRHWNCFPPKLSLKSSQLHLSCHKCAVKWTIFYLGLSFKHFLGGHGDPVLRLTSTRPLVVHGVQVPYTPIPLSLRKYSLPPTFIASLCPWSKYRHGHNSDAYRRETLKVKAEAKIGPVGLGASLALRPWISDCCKRLTVRATACLMKWRVGYWLKHKTLKYSTKTGSF